MPLPDIPEVSDGRKLGPSSGTGTNSGGMVNNSSQGRLVYKEQKTVDGEGDAEHVERHLPTNMKKLPWNAEASNVLVGEVDFLERSITAFVRLSTSQLLGDLTEVPIPTRYRFPV